MELILKVADIVLLILLLVVFSSVCALWVKFSLNEIRGRKGFARYAEEGVFVKRGLSVNKKTGKATGQQRPIAVSSVK